MLLYLVAVESEIMPPELRVAGDDDVDILIYDGLLVTAQMEEAGIVEHLTYLMDHIRAELIILRCRDHTTVFFHPGVVAGGEIQLGTGFESQRAHFIQLLPQEILIPRVGNGNLRVAFIPDAIGNIDQNQIVLSLCQEFYHGIPGFNLSAHLLPVRLGHIPLCLAGLICPHMVSQVKHISPNQFIFHRVPPNTKFIFIVAGSYDRVNASPNSILTSFFHTLTFRKHRIIGFSRQKQKISKQGIDYFEIYGIIIMYSYAPMGCKGNILM